MTNEEQKEKYREWLLGLARQGELIAETNLQTCSTLRVDTGEPVRAAFLEDGDYAIFSEIEFNRMVAEALIISRAVLLNSPEAFSRHVKWSGILEQIKRDNPVK